MPFGTTKLPGDIKIMDRGQFGLVRQQKPYHNNHHNHHHSHGHPNHHQHQQQQKHQQKQQYHQQSDGHDYSEKTPKPPSICIAPGVKRRTLISHSQDALDYAMNKIILLIQIAFDIWDETPTEKITNDSETCRPEYIGLAGDSRKATTINYTPNDKLWDSAFGMGPDGEAGANDGFSNHSHTHTRASTTTTTTLFDDPDIEFNAMSDQTLHNHKLKLLRRWASASFMDCSQTIIKNISVIASKYILASINDFVGSISTYENSNIVEHKCVYATLVPTLDSDDSVCPEVQDPRQHLLLFIDNLLFSQLLNSSLYFYMYGEVIEFVINTEVKQSPMTTPQLAQYLVSLVDKTKSDASCASDSGGHGEMTKRDATTLCGSSTADGSNSGGSNGINNVIGVGGGNTNNGTIYDIASDNLPSQNKSGGLNAKYGTLFPLPDEHENQHATNENILAELMGMFVAPATAITNGKSKNMVLLTTTMLILDRVLDDIHRSETFVGHCVDPCTISQFIENTAVLIKDGGAANESTKKRKTISII